MYLDQIARAGRPRSDVERVMNHYGVNRAEAENMLLRGSGILPPRGSGLGTEPELTALPSDWPQELMIRGAVYARIKRLDDEVKLVMTPFPRLVKQNIRFASSRVIEYYDRNKRFIGTVIWHTRIKPTVQKVRAKLLR